MRGLGPLSHDTIVHACEDFFAKTISAVGMGITAWLHFF